MISKKAVTVVLLIVLFYLLFIKNVEGMETSGDNEGGFFSFFSNFFGGMLNLFFDDEGEDENEKCKLNKTIINEIYEFNIDNLDFDLTELIITIFNNLSNEDPYSDRCSISRKHLIDYGFSKLIVDYTFKEIFNDTQELEFERFNKFIKSLLNTFRRRNIEGMNNDIDIDKLENKMKGNPKDLIMSGVALLFCFIANGKTSLKKNKINENFRIICSINGYSKNAARLITRIRPGLLKDLFSIFADGKNENYITRF